MEMVLTVVLATVIFLGAVFALFVVITRGTRMLFGSRRRLEAEMGLDALRARLARGEIHGAGVRTGQAGAWRLTVCEGHRRPPCDGHADPEFVDRGRPVLASIRRAELSPSSPIMGIRVATLTIIWLDVVYVAYLCGRLRVEPT
jgi:hypothetical protein